MDKNEYDLDIDELSHRDKSNPINTNIHFQDRLFVESKHATLLKKLQKIKDWNKNKYKHKYKTAKRKQYKYKHKYKKIWQIDLRMKIMWNMVLKVESL